jgi:hypothetical protein
VANEFGPAPMQAIALEHPDPETGPPMSGQRQLRPPEFHALSDADAKSLLEIVRRVV